MDPTAAPSSCVALAASTRGDLVPLLNLG